MTTPTLTPPPDAPDRLTQAQPAFSAAYSAFLSWLKVFAAEIATAISWIADQVTQVGTDATNAGTSASNAATAASNASTSAGEASGSAQTATSAEASIKRFYLGDHASDPLVDLNGDLVADGQWYTNTALGMIRVRIAGNFVAGVMDANGALVAANNLSDLADSAAARENLNVMSKSEAKRFALWNGA